MTTPSTNFLDTHPIAIIKANGPKIQNQEKKLGHYRFFVEEVDFSISAVKIDFFTKIHRKHPKSYPVRTLSDFKLSSAQNKTQIKCRLTLRVHKISILGLEIAKKKSVLFDFYVDLLSSSALYAYN